MAHFLKSTVGKLRVDLNDSNNSKDDRPIPSPEDCQWGVVDFFSTLTWAAFAITTWTSGSMLLALGLTVPQAIGAATVAHCSQTALYIAAGHSGVIWRLSNPLGIRLTWGVKGYRFIILCTIAVTTCYTGIQMVFGYLCMKVVICAMIPSFATMQNTFSNALPTNDFICMVIFLIFSLIFYYLPVNTWRIVGPYAATVTFIAFIAIVAVCCARAGGVGPLFYELFNYFSLEEKPSTSQVVWAFFLAVSSLSATHSALAEANYTRFARNFIAPIPAQIVGHAILPILVTVFGIVATSAAVKIFPEEKKLLWAPYEILLAFQQSENAGPGTRAATFFGGIVMVFPQLGMNVFWNAYVNGVRYTLLLPRWFTVKRGGFLTLTLGVAINPWLFANKPTGFNLFLNGTAMFYGTITGIFLVDYFSVRKALVKVSDILLLDDRSIYWYTKGTNWRAVVALLAAVWLVIPGWIMILINNNRILNNPWEKIYGLAWMLTFFVGGLFYYAFSRIWPMEGLGETDSVEKDTEDVTKEESVAKGSQADEEKAAPSAVVPTDPI